MLREVEKRGSTRLRCSSDAAKYYVIRSAATPIDPLTREVSRMMLGKLRIPSQM